MNTTPKADITAPAPASNPKNESALEHAEQFLDRLLAIEDLKLSSPTPSGQAKARPYKET
ncbi:MAG: hypothetical protein IJU62_07450 [Muribaculaceae bacterium]|nr:hypothetical protein [Muribaculaceae bacterium]